MRSAPAISLCAAIVCTAALLLASSPEGRADGNTLGPVQDVEPYSPEEKELLRSLDADMRVFEQGARIFTNTVRHLIERAYLNEKALLERKHKSLIDKAALNASARRLEAIKEYEAFVKRHPRDPVWTPDVLMRLAELYYEKAEEDFKVADKAYQAKVAEAERVYRLTKRELPVPEKPIKEYEAALDYYREILTKFPAYKNRDMVIYVLGFVLRLAAQEVEASDNEKLRGRARELHAMARQALLGLVCANRFQAMGRPVEPGAPSGYSVSVVRPAQDPSVGNPFEGFDPYDGCEPVVKLDGFTGEELQRRRVLLSQSWFLIGEGHFDADPWVEIDAEEREKLNQEYQAYKGPYKEEVFRNRWNEMQNEKKLRLLRVHNFYAISAYTRVATGFQDSKEYHSALYKRAWTYFKIDNYLKALNEFDELLIRAKEKDLLENAIRYVALCAFYQKERPTDPFGYLMGYYKKKGWLNDAGSMRYTHVKAAFHQLAEVLWAEAQPPPDDPSTAQHDGEMLQKALTIYRWVLLKGGFSGDETDPENEDRDWIFYKGKAPIQVKVLQILGLLTVNTDKRIRDKYPRSAIYEERKHAFDRYAIFRGNPNLRYATEYDRRWGSDKEVAEALMVLRENSLMAMGRDFFNLGAQHYNASEKASAELKGLKARQVELERIVQERTGDWRKARTELRKLLGRVQELEEQLPGHKKAYQSYFDQAAKAFLAIIEHPQYKDTLTSYDAQFFMGQALYYAGKHLEAARLFQAVQQSKISVKHARDARTWRITAFSEVIADIKIPPDPDPAKEKTVERQDIPELLLEYHQLLKDVIAADPKSPDVPLYRYVIAAHYYRYRQFPEARPLFVELMAKHCNTKQAFYAGQHLLAMLSIEKPPDYLDQLERLVNEVRSKNCGAEVQCKPDEQDCDKYLALRKKTEEDMKKYGPEILRARAFAAFKAKEYEQAALYFAEIIKRYPDSKEIALFLYNAAYSYERIKRFQSAKRMYELIYTKYPKQATETKVKDEHGKVLDDGILDNVLEYLAQVAIKALDYESALKYFAILATEDSFASHPGRVAWYYSYARLLKVHGRYDEAVRYFREKYVAEVKGQLPRWRSLARTEPDPEKKKMYEQFEKDAQIFVPRAELEIGQIRERQRKYELMVAAYLRYVSEIERELDQKRGQILGPDYWEKNLADFSKAREMMQLLQKVADTLKEQNISRREATRIEDRIVENFDRYRLPPRTQAATSAAAIVFARMQDSLEQFKKVKFTYKPVRVRWNWNKQNAFKNRNEVIQKSRDAVADALKELSDEVGRVTKLYMDRRNRYTDDVWYVAFQAHIGKIYEHAASLVADPKLPDLAQKWLDTFKKELEDPFEFEEKTKGFVFGTPNKLEQAAQTWEKMAKDFYRAGLDHAEKAGVVTNWTRQVREWLSRIDPSRPYIHEPKIEALR
ncbi:MAG: tetratricopeptide repeat protein [Polyangia bacterium]|jgi:tetratricopeptide (TPR) repeat protein|nr:tetratricopeptide repeat protein [Polyangia bacterium]